MFTHDQIWAAIDRLAEGKGLSASGLARQAGLDPTAFNRSKRISPNGKPRWPSTESISKILGVTDSTMSDLLALMDLEEKQTRTIPVLTFSSVRSGKISAPRNPDVMPITFDAGDEAFAVSLDNNKFAPLFRNGCTVIADPDVKVKAEDRVILYARKAGLIGGILKNYQRKTYNILIPSDDFQEESFDDSDVQWIARVLWSSH
jgi:phage repressor protein C with HTH and peptisase S24 domain